MLKSIELENAVDRLRSKVLAMQLAVNAGCSVEELNNHYVSVKEMGASVVRLVSEVRSGCFQIAAKYHFEWDE